MCAGRGCFRIGDCEVAGFEEYRGEGRQERRGVRVRVRRVGGDGDGGWGGARFERVCWWWVGEGLVGGAGGADIFGGIKGCAE